MLDHLRFADHCGFKPVAWHPYRAKTKGRVERAVSYLRSSFFYGRSFRDLEDLNTRIELPTSCSQSYLRTGTGWRPAMTGNRGYDAGKKVKGRNRHIVVDTQGLLLAVHPADIQDRDGAKLVLRLVTGLAADVLYWNGIQLITGKLHLSATCGILNQAPAVPFGHLYLANWEELHYRKKVSGYL